MIGDTYTCWSCNQVFPDKRQLEIHIKIEHGQLVFGQSDWFGCRLCYNTLYCRRQDIVKHMRNAHQEEFIQAEDYLIKSAEDINLPCEECGELNLFSKLCKDHNGGSLKEKEIHVCSYCLEEFSDDKILEAHVNIEHGKQVYADAEFECYQCHQCGSELYLGSDAFLRHMLQAHGDDSVSLDSHVVKCLADIVTVCNLCKAPCLFSMFCKKHDAEVSSLQCESHTHHNCTLCDAVFANCQLLWKHKFSVHTDESLVCNLCDKSQDLVLIRSPSVLMAHWRQSHWTIRDQMKYQCSHCNSKFTKLEQLKEHLISLHYANNGKRKNMDSESGDEDVEYRLSDLNKDKFKFIVGNQVKYKCSECDKSYTRFYELKCHLMIHKGERNMVCTICDKSFYQGSRLTEHYKRTHNMKVTRVNELKQQSEICIEGVTKYKCPMCPSITSRYDSLQQHLRVHTGERPFSCEVCGKTFMAREHLKRHFNNIHMRVGYQCNICGRVLTDSSNLKVHMRNHTGEKKYMCEVCGKGFTQWASHYYHKFTHKEDRAFKCPYCAMTFRCPRTLTDHKKIHVMSDVKHVCETCGSEFNTRKNLLSHVKIHVSGRPHQCDVCNAKFKLRKYLIQHLKTHKAAIKLENIE